jgi:hypothetical protein
VPAGLSLEELSRVRGSYLASRGLGAPIKLLHDLEARDATLRRAATFDEVVLWFEHDLYDQLQILQILTTLADMRLESGAVSIVQSGDYLGSMTADELAPLYPKRRTVTKSMFAAARNVWDAFTSEDPRNVETLVRADTPGFPYMRAALSRLCEEFPWTSDGLSRSHRQALLASAQGPGRNDELFRRAQAREEAPFLGDSTFYALLEDLRREPALVEEEEGVLVPTVLGRRVLAGDAVPREALRSGRWIGGVDLSTQAVRWDGDASTFRVGVMEEDS